MVPNLIAYPTRVFHEETKELYKTLFEATDEVLQEDDKVQERFDAWSKPVIKQVIDDLRARKAYLIDDRAVDAIRKGNVGYKLFDDDKKCLQSYADT